MPTSDIANDTNVPKKSLIKPFHISYSIPDARVVVTIIEKFYSAAICFEEFYKTESEKTCITITTRMNYGHRFDCK